ncbi:class I SAM-dependent methyltransferase [Microbacterium sp. NEAU-LLC]|uniref:Class I SAM-dependent methyltransferase n=1 Tax=Microbacterium helvum TaxID=2773713 RepID=A0ABR8NSM1_9MICO|nr:class I SAM-dependent methyltransferase [Microbacterium helvum]MBD3943442.1 class I SAM-dependent methyltransferase [Microbacterium helvum]
MTDAELAKTFLTIGEEYERYRPGFPDEIAAAVAPERMRHILDLAAGTGKFTERLVSRADRVVAVDPSEPMLAELRRKLPEVSALIGTAEAIPLPDAGFELVTVAQAYHWFDPEPASREIRRVLTPTGRLALIWNAPDPRCAWDSDAYRIAHPRPESESASAEPATVLPRWDVPGFTQVDSIRFPWSEQITRSDYLSRWMTVSTFLAADERERSELVRRVEGVLDDHPDTRGRHVLQLPQVTDALLYEQTA